MAEFLKQIEIDNIIALLLIGVIAVVAMCTKTTDNQIVATIAGSLGGYVAKGAIVAARK